MPPGRPFWSAFTAFAANMVALLTVSALNLNWLAIDSEVLTSIVVSGFVGAVVYGEAKLADLNSRENP